jgi:hypothetical protein
LALGAEMAGHAAIGPAITGGHFDDTRQLAVAQSEAPAPVLLAHPSRSQRHSRRRCQSHKHKDGRQDQTDAQKAGVSRHIKRHVTKPPRANKKANQGRGTSPRQ